MMMLVVSIIDDNEDDEDDEARLHEGSAQGGVIAVGPHQTVGLEKAK